LYLLKEKQTDVETLTDLPIGRTLMQHIYVGSGCKSLLWSSSATLLFSPPLYTDFLGLDREQYRSLHANMQETDGEASSFLSFLNGADDNDSQLPRNVRSLRKTAMKRIEEER